MLQIGFSNTLLKCYTKTLTNRSYTRVSLAPQNQRLDPRIANHAAGVFKYFAKMSKLGLPEDISSSIYLNGLQDDAVSALASAAIGFKNFDAFVHIAECMSETASISADASSKAVKSARLHENSQYLRSIRLAVQNNAKRQFPKLKLTPADIHESVSKCVLNNQLDEALGWMSVGETIYNYALGEPTYAIILNGSVQNNAWDLAFSVMADMRLRGFTISRKMYETMIRECMLRPERNWRHAQVLALDMVQNHIQKPIIQSRVSSSNSTVVGSGGAVTSNGVLRSVANALDTLLAARQYHAVCSTWASIAVAAESESGDQLWLKPYSLALIALKDDDKFFQLVQDKLISYGLSMPSLSPVVTRSSWLCQGMQQLLGVVDKDSRCGTLLGASIAWLMHNGHAEPARELWLGSGQVAGIDRLNAEAAEALIMIARSSQHTHATHLKSAQLDLQLQEISSEDHTVLQISQLCRDALTCMRRQGVSVLPVRGSDNGPTSSSSSAVIPLSQSLASELMSVFLRVQDCNSAIQLLTFAEAENVRISESSFAQLLRLLLLDNDFSLVVELSDLYLNRAASEKAATAKIISSKQTQRGPDKHAARAGDDTTAHVEKKTKKQSKLRSDDGHAAGSLLCGPVLEALAQLNEVDKMAELVLFGMPARGISVGPHHCVVVMKALSQAGRHAEGLNMFYNLLGLLDNNDVLATASVDSSSPSKQDSNSSSNRRSNSKSKSSGSAPLSPPQSLQGDMYCAVVHAALTCCAKGRLAEHAMLIFAMDEQHRDVRGGTHMHAANSGNEMRNFQLVVEAFTSAEGIEMLPPLLLHMECKERAVLGTREALLWCAASAVTVGSWTVASDMVKAMRQRGYDVGDNTIQEIISVAVSSFGLPIESKLLSHSQLMKIL